MVLVNSTGEGLRLGMELWGMRQHPREQQRGQPVSVKDLKGRGVGMRARDEQAETAGGFMVYELAD